MAHKDELHGTVKLLFQMAEEIGTESRHYVEHGCLDDVDAIFGQHVWSLMDSGKVNIEDGERMACSDRFTINITGQSAPADKPQQGRDAVLAAAAAVMALRQPRKRPQQHPCCNHRHDERRQRRGCCGR